MSIHRFSLSLMFFQIFLLFPSIISAIRNHIGLPQVNTTCRSTVQGRYLLTDDNGHVCDALSIDSVSHCCLEKGEKFSLGAILFHNVAIPMNIVFHAARILQGQKGNKYLKSELPSQPPQAHMSASLISVLGGVVIILRVSCTKMLITVITITAFLCRHMLQLKLGLVGVNSTQLEFRLNGINVIIGRQGESCDSVCKSNGQSCVSNKILVLNHCDIIQKYLSCKGGCIASVGPDQPAEVSYNAPKELNPGACLYSSAQSMLSCDGSHPHTKRLCPCA